MIGRAARIGAVTAVAAVALGVIAAVGQPATGASRGAGGAVAAARDATRPFQNLQHAMNSGYGFFTDAKGIACIDMKGMGGMGVHFVNSTLVGNATERVRTPEAVVYRIDPHGKLVLAALEYVVLKSAWDATHSARPRLFGHTFNFTPAGNRYGLPPFYSLHAWVW